MTYTGAEATDRELAIAEHDSTANVKLKKVGLYVWDANGMQWVRVGATSSGVVLTGDSFPIGEYDTIELDYTGTRVDAVRYQLGNDVVATLTLNYTGNTLDSVIRT